MMRRRQFPDVLEDRPRRRDVTVGQIIVERSGVDVACDVGMAKQRVKLGGENKLSVAQCVKERLLANAITREEQRPRRVVPERESEHSTEGFDAVRPTVFPRVHDDFGVALCRKTMPPM